MISVVVPIFNEEENIARFHDAVADALMDIGEEWEVVYVNDGSRDASLDLLRTLQETDPRIVVVDLSRNWGHMGAISAGLQSARGDAVIVMDGDFQDPPEVIPELVDAWRGGAQVVVAVRRSRAESRRVLARLFPLFYRVLGALSDFPIPLNAGIFGLMDRQTVDSINAMRENNRYLPGLRAWVGYNNAVVYYHRQDRAAGEGKLTFLSRIKYAMDAILSFSYKPLRLCFVLSGISCSAAALFAIGSVFSSSAIDSVGFGVSSAVFLVGGGLLLCLGVLGEYLGRVYDEVRQRPLSIINKVYYASDVPAVLGNPPGYEEEPPGRIVRIA
ncbi:MAG TPA: glycosyltransferase family 2 protein [Acidobacteriaceae bacterium]|nr:glycosyltransferase family 2 protein [Acidobacteriaceae bacterium]